MSMSSSSRTGLLLTGVILILLAPLVQAEGTLRLNFGVYSSTKPSAMVRVYRPILRELEVKMSQRLEREVDIRMQIANDYDDGISHLVNGNVDFSAFGPASYVEAKRMNNDITIIALENEKNSKVFYGVIAVGKDSPISSITDLRGKSFAFGDEGSTIGRFLSQLELDQAGIKAVDLSRYEYLGRHDKVGTAVGAGSFDAGALSEKTFRQLVNAGENIRELVRFPNVTKPWIARSGLDENILAALRKSLLEINNAETLVSLKIDGFLEGTDEDYKVIRKAMDNNAGFFAEHDKTATLTPYSSQFSKVVDGSEPALQAAVASAENTSSNKADLVTDLDPVSITSGQTPGTDGRYITINISLPRSLLSTSEGTGSRALTINLSVPEMDDAPSTLPLDR